MKLSQPAVSALLIHFIRPFPATSNQVPGNAPIMYLGTGPNNLQWPRQRIGTSNIDDNPCTAGITWADANLAALGDNGGPNATMMPQTGSQAIGAGADCPATDQRGQARPAQDCTVGAVEHQ